MASELVHKAIKIKKKSLDLLQNLEDDQSAMSAVQV